MPISMSVLYNNFILILCKSLCICSRHVTLFLCVNVVYVVIKASKY
jgi:hypothetical protein